MDIDKLIELKNQNDTDMNRLFLTMSDIHIIVEDNLLKCTDELLGKLASFLPYENVSLYMDVNHMYLTSNFYRETYRVPYFTRDGEEEVYFVIDLNEIVKTPLPEYPLILCAHQNKEGTVFSFNLNDATGIFVYHIYESAQKSRRWGENDVFFDYDDAIEELIKAQRHKADFSSFSTARELERILEDKGVSKKEFGEAMGIKYKTVLSKFNMDTFSAGEILLAAKIYDIDLNKLKEQVPHKVVIKEEVIKHIIYCLRNRHLMGIEPYWKLYFVESPGSFSYEELDEVIAALKEGEIEGTVTARYPRKWKLVYSENTEAPRRLSKYGHAIDMGLMDNYIEPKSIDVEKRRKAAASFLSNLTWNE